MAWYDRLLGREAGQQPEVEEKLNPAQQYYDHQTAPSREFTLKYEKAYEDIEIVNRGVNLIVDDASEIKTTVGEQIQGLQSIVKGVKRSRVRLLLNKEPNPFQDISTFKRNLLTDYLIDGNIFVYFDGVHLYHLPANKVNIHASKTSYIDKFTFNETVDYSPSEIIHIKDNSFYSIYRGISRLKPALRTMILMQNMRQFQDNFFKNGAVPGLVLKSPNTLSEKIKERMIQSWSLRYRPDSGGRRPLILDGGIEIDSISNTNFRELDFQQAIQENEKIILKAGGQISASSLLLASGSFVVDPDNLSRFGQDGFQSFVMAENTGVIAPSDYQTDLTVEQLDRDDTVLKSYVFRAAYPLTVAAIELSNAEATEIETFEVTWRYQHFEPSGVL